MWQKKALIFNVSGNYDWNKSHAQVPVVDVLEDRLRIYYSTRNAAGRSTISFIEVNKNAPEEILYEHPGPLFAMGNPGTFDDSGLMPSSIIQVGGKKYLYYIGWTTRRTVPYQNAVGLAISHDGGISFEKYSEGPIISVNAREPYFSGTSFVMADDGIYKMWYLSCTGWLQAGESLDPLYHIKYAESTDGINWLQTGKVAVELEEGEGGLASAAVIKEDGLYKMWFGKRKKEDYRNNLANTYRIGYAESLDGVNWSRADELSGIDVSKEGWDAQMISYPYIVVYGGRKYLFYNGNHFGKTGFGYAVWR